MVLTKLFQIKTDRLSKKLSGVFMESILKLPPSDPSSLTDPAELAERLKLLVGKPFPLTGVTRTDGSNARRLIASQLCEFPLPQPCDVSDFRIVSPKKKGVPRILLEFIDTYIVTTGTSYNLQVWNRNPSISSVQIDYFKNGKTLRTDDVRFVFLKISNASHKVSSILVLSPDYIVNHFGNFGKPTIKHQLIISEQQRQRVKSNDPPIFFYPDNASLKKLTIKKADLSHSNPHSQCEKGKLLNLETIKEIVTKELLGKVIVPGQTKNRGQSFEEMVITALGYPRNLDSSLAGGFPDISHQALEVKIQDSPTVDLGLNSPQFEEAVASCPGISTSSLRYIIALTNEKNSKIEGLVFAPGSKLSQLFTYVADTSFKCQRSIPMSFFDSFDGQSVYNPLWP